jgi:hypothetical protein
MTNKSDNTAVGYQALYYNAEDLNTAVGSYALYANTTGYYNVAMGYETLKQCTTGYGNVCIGMRAGQVLTTSNLNVCMGYRAGIALTTGSGGNVLLGGAAGLGVTTGYSNVMIGNNCGVNITSGIGNLFLGAEIIASSGAVSNEMVMAIANGQTGKGANTGFVAFSGGIYHGGNTTTWATTSDRRIKKNIVDNTDGLNIISQVRIRNFEYRLKNEVTDLPTHAAIEKEGVQLGVIAQEFQEVLPNSVKEQSTGVLSVDSDNLTWYMINAIKELKTLVDAQKAEFDAYKLTHP